MFFGSQILIFFAVGLQIRQNISLVASQCCRISVPTKLLCRLICNLPEYNIRIFQSPCRRICSNDAIVPADLQSAGIEYKDFQSACFLLLFNRYELRITDPYITSRADGYVATTLMCRHDGSGMAIEGLKEKQ